MVSSQIDIPEWEVPTNEGYRWVHYWEVNKWVLLFRLYLPVLFFKLTLPSHREANLQRKLQWYIMAPFKKNKRNSVFFGRGGLGHFQYFLLQNNPCLPKQVAAPPPKMCYFSVMTPRLCSLSPSPPITCLNTCAMSIFTVDLSFKTLTVLLCITFCVITSRVKKVHFALKSYCILRWTLFPLMLLHFAAILLLLRRNSPPEKGPILWLVIK